MKHWSERPREIADLLNPSFMGLVLRHSAEGYQSQASIGLPFELTFLTCAIAITADIREMLPKKSNTSMITWLQANPTVRVGLGESVSGLVPFVREAILFGLQNDILRLEKAAICTGNKLRRAPRGFRLSADTRECFDTARFLGKWFAIAGSPKVIFAFWGIRP